MRFEKWQALGNDYIILEREELPWELTGERIRRICKAHTGCHSDGIALLSGPAQPGAVASVRIFNPDGSEAEVSGNGVREAALYLRRSGWAESDKFDLETKAGTVSPSIKSPTTCSVAMGKASLKSGDFPSGAEDGSGALEASGRVWQFQHVNIGNPQCVIDAGDELEKLDLSTIGPEIERSSIFPNRTNVAFTDRTGESEVRARIFERGVGETLSSGTGACASAVAAHLNGTKSPVTVHLDGGDLEVEIVEDLQLTLTGWAVPVFSGKFSREFIDDLERVS